MRKLILILLLFQLFPACYSHSNAKDVSWPDISFMVIDEIPEKYVFERCDDYNATVGRVLLLPIVDNYKRKYKLAVVDPIIAVPGRDLMRGLFSKLSTNGQQVRRCIVLANGYCPGVLQPNINYAGKDNGKDVWLIELARISKEQYRKVYEIIINELSHRELMIGGEAIFNDALKNYKLISISELLSPIIRDNRHDYSNTIVLWNVKEGTEVVNCISDRGIEIIKKELGVFE